MIKAVLLGLTNSGKSTTAAILKAKGWPVVEIDDIAQARNSDVWPESEALLDRLFKAITEEILLRENLVFVTSFLEIADVIRFKQAGFKILELHASYEELKRRKIKRDGYPKDAFERFDRNYANYQRIMSEVNHYISLSLDTTLLTSEDLAKMIEVELSR